VDVVDVPVADGRMMMLQKPETQEGLEGSHGRIVAPVNYLLVNAAVVGWGQSRKNMSSRAILQACQKAQFSP